MVAVFSVLVILMVSLVIVRIATVALTLTGLSEPLARFQARSAFTGVGFTTHESEAVVNHPVRRRVIMVLMLLGQAGVVTAVSSLILSFVGSSEATGWAGSRWTHFGVLAAGVLGIWALAYSKQIDRWMSRVIAAGLRRWTDIEVRDYAALLRLSHDYTVSELQVRAGDWLAERTLKQLQLASEGVLVLGIERSDGRYVGAPRGDNHIRAGDTLILYARQDRLARLDVRQAGFDGNVEHMLAIDEQLDIEEQQRRQENGGQPPPSHR